ncbi:MAG: maleylpyruvate isomerase family mycothiol-dependent enzyme [Stackebrandtia sp.]
MEPSRLNACLTSDATLLAAAAVDGRTDAVVPSCPDWTLGDLLEHVTHVYDHKTQCMRLGKAPDPWPPEHPRQGELLTRLRGALGDLLAEFDSRDPSSPSYTWYEPDQTVGFWIRRMAQETVIHRVDAEQAAGKPISPIDDDLAVDGVDEVLAIMLSWGSRTWIDEARPELEKTAGKPVAITAGSRSWTVKPTSDGVELADGASPEAAAMISGAPSQVLLWLWRRADYDSVAVEGDADAARELYDLLALFTS